MEIEGLMKHLRAVKGQPDHNIDEEGCTNRANAAQVSMGVTAAWVGQVCSR